MVRQPFGSFVAVFTSTRVWARTHSPGTLLARRGRCRDRMAHPRCVRTGDAVGSVARDRTWMLSRRRRPILVARRPALAEPREVAPVMRALVSFPCHLTVRRALGSSRILRPGCLPPLCVCTWPLQYPPSPRPGVCVRADVG